MRVTDHGPTQRPCGSCGTTTEARSWHILTYPTGHTERRVLCADCAYAECLTCFGSGYEPGIYEHEEGGPRPCPDCA